MTAANARWIRRGVLFLPLLPLFALGASARAADAGADGGADAGAPLPWCNDDAVVGPLRVYVSGAAKSYVGYFGQQLAKASTPITLVYQRTGSCAGIDTIANPDPSKRLMTGKAQYVDASGTLHDCTMTPPAGVDAGSPAYPTVDIGVADVFASTCGYTTLPQDVGDYWGPVSPAVFVTSPASTQIAISAEQAYHAFGVGDTVAAPWTDPHYLLTRGPASGTQQLVAHAIDVPADQWWGVNVGATGNDAIHTFLFGLQPPNADKGLGVLSSAYAASFNNEVKVLAFQSKGQIAAFWPDSMPSARDKQNVRDGHYPMWGVLHFFAHLSNGQPSATAAAITSRLEAIHPDPALLDVAINEETVPQCAMHVKRTTELGPLSPFTPAARCGCYFEAKATGTTSCKTCAQDADCGSSSQSCNYGYCEVK